MARSRYPLALLLSIIMLSACGGSGGNSGLPAVSTSNQTGASYALPTPNSAPWEIISAPDGTLWFTESAANKVGKLQY